MSPLSLQLAVTCLSGAAAFVSAACTVFTVLNAGRRLKSSEAKALSDRIDHAQTAADRWHETTTAKVMQAQAESNSTKIATCENRLENAATKTELAHVEGTINRVESIVEDVKGGVDRIESMLMRKALNA